MTREEKIAKAAELREKDWTLKEIAVRLDTSITTARRWTDPEFYEADKRKARAWKSRNKSHLREYDKGYREFAMQECVECGGPLDPKATTGICRGCRKDRRHKRGLRIEELWAEGKKLREVAAEVGMPMDRIGVEFAWLRKNGYDLPHRYRWDPVHRLRLPEKSAV